MAILKPMPHVAKQIQICKSAALPNKSRMKQGHHNAIGMLYTDPVREDGLFPSASFVYLELQKLAQGWEDWRQGANVFQTFLTVLQNENNLFSSNIYENLRTEISYYLQRMYQNIPDQAGRLEQWYNTLLKFTEFSKQNQETRIFRQEIEYLELLWKAESRLLEQQIYEKWNQLLPLNQEKFHFGEKTAAMPDAQSAAHAASASDAEIKKLILKEVQQEFHKIEAFCSGEQESLLRHTAENKTEGIRQVTEATETNTVSSESELRLDFAQSDMKQYFSYLDADEWISTVQQLAQESITLPESVLAKTIADAGQQLAEMQKLTAYGTEQETGDAQMQLLHIRDEFLRGVSSFSREEQKQLWEKLTENTVITEIAARMGFRWTAEEKTSVDTADPADVRSHENEGRSAFSEKQNALSREGFEKTEYEFSMSQQIAMQQQITLLQKRDAFLEQLQKLSEASHTELLRLIQETPGLTELAEQFGLDGQQEAGLGIETFFSNLNAEEWVQTVDTLVHRVEPKNAQELHDEILKAYEETKQLLQQKQETENERILETGAAGNVTEKVFIREIAEANTEANANAEAGGKQYGSERPHWMDASNADLFKYELSLHPEKNTDTRTAAEIVDGRTEHEIREKNLAEIYRSMGSEAWLENLIYLHQHLKELKSPVLQQLVQSQYRELQDDLQQVYRRLGISAEDFAGNAAEQVDEQILEDAEKILSQRISVSRMWNSPVLQSILTEWKSRPEVITEFVKQRERIESHTNTNSNPAEEWKQATKLSETVEEGAEQEIPEQALKSWIEYLEQQNSAESAEARGAVERESNIEGKTDSQKRNDSELSESAFAESEKIYLELQEQVSEQIREQLKQLVEEHYQTDHVRMEETIAQMSKQEKEAVFTLLHQNQETENERILKTGAAGNVTEKIFIRETAEANTEANAEAGGKQYGSEVPHWMDASNADSFKYELSLHPEEKNAEVRAATEIVDGRKEHEIREEDLAEIYQSMSSESWFENLVYFHQHLKEVKSPALQQLVQSQYRELQDDLQQAYRRLGISAGDSAENAAEQVDEQILEDAEKILSQRISVSRMWNSPVLKSILTEWKSRPEVITEFAKQMERIESHTNTKLAEEWKQATKQLETCSEGAEQEIPEQALKSWIEYLEQNHRQEVQKMHGMHAEQAALRQNSAESAEEKEVIERESKIEERNDNRKRNDSELSEPAFAEYEKIYLALQEQVSESIREQLKQLVKEHYQTDHVRMEETIAQMSKQEKKAFFTLLHQKQETENERILKTGAAGNITEKVFIYENTEANAQVNVEAVGNQYGSVLPHWMDASNADSLKYDLSLHPEEKNADAQAAAEIVDGRTEHEIREEDLAEIYQSMGSESWFENLVYFHQHLKEVRSPALQQMVQSQYRELQDDLQQAYRRLGIFTEDSAGDSAEKVSEQRLEDPEKILSQPISVSRMWNSPVLQAVLEEWKNRPEVITEFARQRDVLESHTNTKLAEEWKQATTLSETVEEVAEQEIPEQALKSWIAYLEQHHMQEVHEMQKTHGMHATHTALRQNAAESAEAKGVIERESNIEGRNDNRKRNDTELSKSTLAESEKIYLELQEQVTEQIREQLKQLVEERYQAERLSMKETLGQISEQEKEAVFILLHQKHQTENERILNPGVAGNVTEKAFIHNHEKANAEAVGKQYGSALPHWMDASNADSLKHDPRLHQEGSNADVQLAIETVNERTEHEIWAEGLEEIYPSVGSNEWLNKLIYLHQHLKEVKSPALQQLVQMQYRELQSDLQQAYSRSGSAAENAEQEETLSYETMRMPSMVVTRPQPPSFKNMPQSWRAGIGQQLDEKLEEVFQKKTVLLTENGSDTSFGTDIRQTVNPAASQVWKETTEKLEKKIKVQEKLLKELQENQMHLSSDEMMKRITERTLKEMHQELKLERMRRGLR